MAEATVEHNGVPGPVVEYSGVVQSVEPTSGGKRLRVFVERAGRANDLLMYPADAGVVAGQALSRVKVRPAVETDSQNRPLGTIVYWVD